MVTTSSTTRSAPDKVEACTPGRYRAALFVGLHAGLAPKTARGWRAMQTALADGQWHSQDELVGAAVSTGLARRTGLNLVGCARLVGLIEADMSGGRQRLLRRLPVCPLPRAAENPRWIPPRVLAREALPGSAFALSDGSTTCAARNTDGVGQ